MPAPEDTHTAKQATGLSIAEMTTNDLERSLAEAVFYIEKWQEEERKAKNEQAHWRWTEQVARSELRRRYGKSS